MSFRQARVEVAVTVAALLGLSPYDLPQLSGGKKPRRAYDPCEGCGKPTRDRLCFTCQQKQPPPDVLVLDPEP